LSSLGIGLGVIAIITIVHIMTDKDSKVILMNLIFFVLVVGFGEEIVFRGFIWSRLVVGFGKVWGTVISGMMFGAMHAPMKIIINETPFIPAIMNALEGGVVSSLIFIYIYTRNNNIVLPSFIHGALDFMR
jgi:membrane protease YdiL (CAAX protease family)